jgi:hypothetical protein
MKRSNTLVAFALVSLTSLTVALSGCPEERKEVTDKVGGAPKEQVDVARERLNKAEDKMQQNAAAAAAATE